MTDSKPVTLYMTKRALSNLDARRFPFSRSKAVSLLLEGQGFIPPVENTECAVRE